MRVIAGFAKAMPLAVPSSGVRPTADRIREAIFSSLGERVIGGHVLDLYAGTGALGLEAASRGAASITFVESARGALENLDLNVTELTKRMSNAAVTPANVQIERGDVSIVLKRLAAAKRLFSMVFADPPYGVEAQQLLLDESLPQLLSADGLLVLESAKRDALTVEKPWELVRESVYGDTRVGFLRTKP